MTMRAGDRSEQPSAGALDPMIERFVREVGAAWANHPNLADVSPERARRIAEAVRRPWAEGGPRMATVIDHHLDAEGHRVRVRCYDPGPLEPKPALIYLHGGGWTLFSLDTHDRLMREYAFRAGLTVVGVDYALSPEAKYPTALHQVCVVVRHLQLHGRDLGVDPTRVAIGGDSAGGNLAIGACLRLLAEGQSNPARGLLLNYAVVDRNISQESHRRFGGAGYMLSTEDMEWFWRNYLSDEREAADPYVSPITADLRGLPPTFLVVPECDVLTEQNLRMAERLRAAGVSVEHRLYHGATHSFLEAVSIAALADCALADSAAWLRSTLDME